MTTARQIIEAGWRRSTANDPGVLAVDLETIAHLDRKFQTYFARWALKAGDKAQEVTTLAWTGSPAIATLPESPIDIVRIETSTGLEVTMVQTTEIDRSWHLAPVCSQIGNILRSRGAIAFAYGHQRDPQNADVSTLYFKGQPARIVTLDDVLDIRYPIRHEMLLVLEMALMLAAKDEGRDPAHFQALTAEQAREEAAFAAAVGEAMTSHNSANA